MSAKPDSRDYKVLAVSPRSADTRSDLLDAELLRLAKSARREMSFTEAYHAFGAADGALELLQHTLDGNGHGPDDEIDWNGVVYLLKNVRRQMQSVYGLLGELRRFEDALRDAGVKGA